MRTVILIGLAAVSGLLFAEEPVAAKVPAPAKAESVEALIKELSSDEFTEREKAEKALFKLGKPISEELKTALKAATDTEARSRLQRLLDELNPPLVLRAELEGEAKVEKPVKFKLRIKNIGEKDAVAVKCLDGSTRDSRFPHFRRSISSDGVHADRNGCGNCNEIGAADIVTLKPGEDFDPIGVNGFGSALLEWTPPKEGKHIVVFTCDYAAPEPALWNGPIERRAGKGELNGLLAQVPKVKLEVKIEVEVKP